MKDANKASWVLVLIGVTKLVKSALLVFVALELHRLLDPNIGDKLADFFRHVRIDPHNRHVHALITRLTGINERKLDALRLGSFLYAGLFATEGLGLVFRQKWAEYLTVVTTSLLLPLEAYELFHGTHRVGKAVLLLVNLGIVIYLVWRLWKSHRDRMEPR